MSLWPEPHQPAAQVTLRFGDVADEVIENLSAGTRLDDTLFVAADEQAQIERLTRSQQDWSAHQRFSIERLLPVAFPDEEADIEGLAADHGWLWVVGSHARTRPKPEKAPDSCIDLAALADLKDTRPRALLGRIPLIEQDGRWTPVARDGTRRAGILKQGRHGNAVAKAFRRDPLLRPFTRIPAKEGGIDVEGIAVCGDRVVLGMRGPVIATHAVLIEFTIRGRKSGMLQLADAPVRRLLALEGLGIRDLKRCGDDLLILAGPTTGLSGPCALYRWRNWVNDPPHDPDRVRLHRPERICELPFGRGADHPEGLALWDDDGDGARQILVICDSPAAARVTGKALLADVFRLPF
ncbi:DUF3616 domain-containing protein [Sphingosinicella sp. BN140058]|uniref:DUF3616 domain-containing protein n=1 Tax=Sphingosinicella sp. BN140058 TaxID=1892855 RepID=UPI0010111AE4|nr:DUF3616 domain-containing protein [Sphingosinicella sp. BN140058]QAY78461.1 DUF3616 domain-containing protein [Sphingosinicella sp. BN140058]